MAADAETPLEAPSPTVVSPTAADAEAEAERSSLLAMAKIGLKRQEARVATITSAVMVSSRASGKSRTRTLGSTSSTTANVLSSSVLK